MACNWWCGLKLYPGIINQQRQHLVGVGDPYFSDVTLLLHMNGTDASTVFTDDSIKEHVVTPVGDAQIDAAVSKFGGASLLLDGSGDGLTIPYVAADFDWHTEDYTIEFWVNASSFASGWENNSAPTGVGRKSLGAITNYWSFGPLNGGALGFYYYNGSPVQVATTALIPTTQQVHCAMVNDGGNIKLFIDGILDITTAIIGTPQSAGEPLTIGGYFGTYLNGHIDDLRITKGVARYSSDFTPPKREFANSVGPDLLTKLVSWWSFDETTGTRADSHGSNDLTENNSPSYVSGKNGNAVDLDGTNQHLAKLSPEGMNTGDNNWSVAGWVNLDELTTAVQDCIVALGDATISTNSDDGFHVGYRAGAEDRFDLTVRTGSTRRNVNASTFGLPSTATWYLLYAYFDSDNDEIGISINDGVIDTLAVTATPNTKSGGFTFGRWGNAGGFPYWLNGKLDGWGFWNRVLRSDEVTRLNEVVGYNDL
jgi:hypothetical protein